MFSKDEAKQLTTTFWTTFGQISQSKRVAEGRTKKWLTHRTGIAAVSLRFEANRRWAQVGIEIIGRTPNEQNRYYNKFLSLREMLDEAFQQQLIWDPDYPLLYGNSCCRIYCQIKDVSTYNKNTWPAIFAFFYEKMTLLEDFFLEYKEFIQEVDSEE